MCCICGQRGGRHNGTKRGYVRFAYMVGGKSVCKTHPDEMSPIMHEACVERVMAWLENRARRENDPQSYLRTARDWKDPVYNRVDAYTPGPRPESHGAVLQSHESGGADSSAEMGCAHWKDGDLHDP